MCYIWIFFALLIFWTVLFNINTKKQRCMYEGFTKRYGERTVHENPFLFDPINTYSVQTPNQYELQPCGNNGFAENGICKSCPIGTDYSQEDGLCYKKNFNITKTFEKVCPRDTISFNDKCIYRCPIGFVENSKTNTCDAQKNTGIKPYLTPLHCPFDTPYLNKNTMKCQKNPPIFIESVNTYSPSYTDLSIIM